MKFIIICAFSALLLSCSSTHYINGEDKYQQFAPDGIPFVIADTIWDVDGRGNQRAIVHVDKQELEAVIVSLLWRRPDLRPETKKIIVTEAGNGNEIKDVSVIELTAEKGTIAFKPVENESDYIVYYLPYKYRKGSGDARYGKPWNDYITPEYETNKNWEENVHKNQENIPYATVTRFESRTKFDFLTSMGVIATEDEKNKLLGGNTSSFLTFPEDRAFPIKLTTIPYRWVINGPSLRFEGDALKNEYYTWQLGLWAIDEEFRDVKVTFTDLIHESNKYNIPKEQITCFNLEGVNWDGSLLKFDVNVQANKVQALWFGVQIPKDAKVGKYKSKLTVSSSNTEEKNIDIEINVRKDILEDNGDGDLWRHSRLRWLNSTIGIDSLPVNPYENMGLHDRQITATKKDVIVAENGAIESIQINDQMVYNQPFEFVVETSKGKFKLDGKNLAIKKDAEGLVSWKSFGNIEQGINLDVSAYMEYDGYIRYNFKLSSESETQIKNVSLLNHFSPESSKYFIGAGFKGGFRPQNYTWNWNGPYDSFWIGGEKSGLHVELRGGVYHGPLINDYKPAPPKTWYNEGQGKVRVYENNAKDDIIVEVSTGELKVEKSIDFEFAFLITPLKPIDLKKQFSQKYYHSSSEGFENAAKEGANIINIHHSRSLNPVINYPFIVRDSLKSYIEEQHKNNRKVKLYYTIRELTNYTEEIFALKSLNHEIFVSGVGYGLPWQCEHLIDDYKPAWYTQLPNQMSDAALVLNGFSRWINYYLEGLRWMLQNYEIDGIYMDDVSFDRSVMKRIRKILEEYRPGSLIDLHSNTGYSIGPANQYTDFFPYVDRLWFGESFKYNEMMPDEWFVTFSGIPFGVMSEMLQDGGNRFLGMVYGTTGRHSYSKYSPAPIWKLWDDFKIEESKMIGYWDEKCPIKTNHENVKATLFVKPDQILISVGNFYNEDKDVQLNINWTELNIDPDKAILEIPEIENFQSHGIISVNDKFIIKNKEGIIFILKEK